jgi:hypothetical protein
MGYRLVYKLAYGCLFVRKVASRCPFLLPVLLLLHILPLAIRKLIYGCLFVYKPLLPLYF